MLSVSSPRRVIHSTTLRATGSLMVLAISSAWPVWPLRKAAIASGTAAMSTDEVEPVAARAKRGPATAVPVEVLDDAALVLGFADLTVGMATGFGLVDAVLPLGFAVAFVSPSLALASVFDLPLVFALGLSVAVLAALSWVAGLSADFPLVVDGV